MDFRVDEVDGGATVFVAYIGEDTAYSVCVFGSDFPSFYCVHRRLESGDAPHYHCDYYEYADCFSRTIDGARTVDEAKEFIRNLVHQSMQEG